MTNDTVRLILMFFCFCALALFSEWRIRNIMEGAFKNALASVLFARSVRTDLDETILTIVKGWKPTMAWVTIGDGEIVKRLWKLAEHSRAIDEELRSKLSDPDAISRAETEAINSLWQTKRDSGIIASDDLVQPPSDMPSLRRPNVPREWNDLPMGRVVKREYEPPAVVKTAPTSAAQRLGIKTFEPEPVRTSRCIHCGKEDYEHIYISENDPILCPEQSPVSVNTKTIKVENGSE